MLFLLFGVSRFAHVSLYFFVQRAKKKENNCFHVALSLPSTRSPNDAIRSVNTPTQDFLSGSLLFYSV